MSLDLFVITKASKMPTATIWAKAVKNESFDIDLDDTFDTRVSSGFRPCLTANRGFEYTFGKLSQEEIKDYSVSSQQLHQIRKLDSVAGFHWKTEADFDVAKVAAAVLARITDGVVLEPESGAVLSPDQALMWARGAFEPPSSTPLRSSSAKPISSLSLARLAIAVLAALSVAYILFKR